MQAPDCIRDTKAGLMKFLDERRKYFLNEEPNPFLEAQMVMYISNAMNSLYKLEVDEDTIIKMYDQDGTIKFEVEA